ncbi:MAG TPA: enoyl-CoA hydratase-related protein [Polyangiaceae bacterium]|nr:enoyl-CoA hydratase-related protein [Polyangiaceae bacterium]
MSEVTTERVARTLIVTLARPEARNALTLDVVRALRSALDEAARDASVRCVILTGGGGHFCAGADLRKNMEDPAVMQKADEYIDEFHGLIRAIVRCPKPTVAMVDGAAVGFGADMALACDLRVVSTRSYVQEKFVGIGLMPDGGGTFWLPRLLGTARAMQLCLLADKLEGPKLAELGVAALAVPAENLRERTLELAARLEKGPPLAYAAIKEALYANLGDLDEALHRERTGQLRLLRTGDVMEGVLAFMQKREPDFKGQ